MNAIDVLNARIKCLKKYNEMAYLKEYSSKTEIIHLHKARLNLIHWEKELGGEK